MCRSKAQQLGFSAAGAIAILLSGCADIQYAYNKPDKPADCPAGTVFRDGGTEIVDRDGGTEIVDRDGNIVSTYCEVQTCPGGGIPTGNPGMVWHQEDHKKVLAVGVCTP